MKEIFCTKDYFMEDGRPAFLAGKRYPYRRATFKEYSGYGVVLCLHSEVGPDHYLSAKDVVVHFSPGAGDIDILRYRAIIDDDFLFRLRECAKFYGWSGDYVEIEKFVAELHQAADVVCPDLAPYEPVE